VTSREQISILFSLKDYLQLVNTTGRRIRTDKRGAIHINLPPILEGYRLTGNNSSNKGSGLKSFMPHNTLKSDEPEKDCLNRNNKPINKNTSSVRGQLYLENGFLG
jgi:hypothetical protein